MPQERTKTMSWEACAWVWGLELPYNEKWALMGLANYCDDKGRAWPALKNLAGKLGRSKRQLIRDLNRITEKGLIAKETRDNNSSVYTLLMPQMSLVGAKLSPTGCQVVTDSSDKVSPNPLISYPTKDTLSSGSITIPELVESWNEQFPTLPQVRLPLSKSRQRKAELRLKEHPQIEFWNTIYTKIYASDFLMCRNGKGWRCTLDFLIANDSNCSKIYEGNYETKKRSGTED